MSTEDRPEERESKSPQVTYPGVYIEEISSGVKPIAGVSTSTTAFLGTAPKGPVNEAKLISTFADFTSEFGELREESTLGHAVSHFFRNGGEVAYVVRVAGREPDFEAGLHALDEVDLFNLLCIPPCADREGTITDVPGDVWRRALAYCAERRAVLLVDAPSTWRDPAQADPSLLGLSGGKNAALYFPWVVMPDPEKKGMRRAFPPCGLVAGLIARTDATRGVWKAPAGAEARLAEVAAPAYELTDEEQDGLNPIGVNCIRRFPELGSVVWGARTLGESEWKYLPVRRTALFIEESLLRGLDWVVFEPNGEPLWARIRMNVGAFLDGLFRRGAFQGTTAREAYFVECDAETTTPPDIALGIVNFLVGFAPLKPAEFVLIQIRLKATA